MDRLHLQRPRCTRSPRTCDRSRTHAPGKRGCVSRHMQMSHSPKASFTERRAHEEEHSTAATLPPSIPSRLCTLAQAASLPCRSALLRSQNAADSPFRPSGCPATVATPCRAPSRPRRQPGVRGGKLLPLPSSGCASWTIRRHAVLLNAS